MVRADGRAFRKILEKRKKPYDLDFARSMAGAAVALFQDSGLAPVMAYAFSDEINLLFTDAPFTGRVEKIDSVVAGSLSGALSLSFGCALSMDCRIIPVCRSEIIDYLIERQDEAWRNHVFSYGFCMLTKEGLTHYQAMEHLRGMKEHSIHELVFQKGVNLARTPLWERRGILCYRKDGKVVEDWELPLFKEEDGKRLIEGILASLKPS